MRISAQIIPAMLRLDDRSIALWCTLCQIAVMNRSYAADVAINDGLPMFWIILLLSTLLLGIERVSYWYVWNHPGRFAARVRRWPRLSSGDPVLALRRLFYGFKAIQIAVLIGWCMLFGGTWLPLPTAGPLLLGIGIALLLIGQLLNFCVMWRLGSTGVFYGNRFGRPIEWQTGFPFSLLPHPQYLGALLSVWGFMLIMRYPNPDWIALPLVSTAWYAWGTRVERE
jgi:methylene-fatty-acyl-phospholipid synthase